LDFVGRGFLGLGLSLGEKIAAIAEKLDLKKNVVRVWFCNQRQKQKRMKFAAQQH